ncbi:MAG: SGNH/GDSL hydrolase family protein [Lachnospiraceae bacterium]|nr:SGNH/GDSL hydrolase family protein [Lachnospiraceae bacterium]
MDIRKEKNNRILTVLLPLFAAAVLITLFLIIRGITASKDPGYISDMEAMKNSDYSVCFLSMYDISCYSADTFELYTLQRSYVAKEVFDDKKSLGYLSDYRKNFVRGTEERHSIIYLGIDPLILADIAGKGAGFERAVEKYFKPFATFDEMTDVEIVFPYYSPAHYASLSSEQLSGLPGYYERIAACFTGNTNIRFHIPSLSEWLFANPYLYEDGSDILVDRDFGERFIPMIMAGFFEIPRENVGTSADKLLDNIRSYDVNYYESRDLSDTCIVVLGDSIFALFRDDTSIDSIISNFSKAKVICKAIGGTPAARIPTDGEDEIFGGQLSDPDALWRETDIAMKDCDKLLFIIEFGLNDYFRGAPADNPADPYDTLSFSGALRTASELLLSKYPDSRILVMSPGFVTVGNNGTAAFSETGDVLSSYRASASEVSSEYGALLYDLTEPGVITQENFTDYCRSDGVHYNEAGNFIIALDLISFIDESL